MIKQCGGSFLSLFRVIGSRKALSLVLLGLIALTLAACNAQNANSSSSSTNPSLSITPGSATRDYNSATSLSNSGRCAQAISLYLRAITESPTYTNAYTGLGLCYQSLGDFAAAITEYNKAIAGDPRQYGLYLDRAGAEALNGSTGAATADDLLALRMAPPLVPTYVTIANSFAGFADLRDAIQTVTKAIDLVPVNPSLYQQRATIELQAQDYPAAYGDLQTAIKYAPSLLTRAGIYSSLANVYSQAQNYSAAFTAIATAIRLQPDSIDLYIQSGTIHQQANNLIEALSLYDHAVRLAKKGSIAETAHEDKGDILAALGRYGAAAADYRVALKLTKDPAIQARLQTKIKNVLASQ